MGEEAVQCSQETLLLPLALSSPAGSRVFSESQLRGGNNIYII